MTPKYILDTSAWYAFVNELDQAHEQAVEVMRAQPSLWVPFTIYEEIAALMHARLGKAVTIKTLQLLSTDPLFKMYSFSSDEVREVEQFYQHTPQYVDYVDASVIWLARKLSVPVFTFDRHFFKLECECIPSR